MVAIYVPQCGPRHYNCQWHIVAHYWSCKACGWVLKPMETVAANFRKTELGITN